MAKPSFTMVFMVFSPRWAELRQRQVLAAKVFRPAGGGKAFEASLDRTRSSLTLRVAEAGEALPVLWKSNRSPRGCRLPDGFQAACSRKDGVRRRDALSLERRAQRGRYRGIFP